MATHQICCLFRNPRNRQEEEDKDKRKDGKPLRGTRHYPVLPGEYRKLVQADGETPAGRLSSQ